MRMSLALLALSCILSACGGGKSDLSADREMDAAGFIASFPAVKVPYRLSDTMLARDPGDSLRVNPALISRFLPDTFLKRDFPRPAKVVCHALGAYTAEDAETYLLIRASAPGRTVAYLLCFDAQPAFRASMPVLSLPVAKRGGGMLLDRNLSIHLYSDGRSARGATDVQRKVYVYNNAGIFTLVMTENPTLVADEGEVYNPIDTLPMKDPMSGNYVQDSRNFVTVRDAGQPGRLHFFIHMERDGGECKGELRGELDVIKAGLARYSKSDDHCSLDFEIRSGVLTVTEAAACGNHRSVRCAFEGSYRKRKPQGRKVKGA